MWFFRRRKKEKKTSRAIERLVVGLIIGGAVGSIVGRHELEEKEKELNGKKEDGEGNEENEEKVVGENDQ